MRAKAAHVAHVLLAIDGMDDRAGAEEEQRLEEGVREEVEDRRAIGADAERHEHVAELRAGRIGDDALDVVLHETDGCREEGGDRADRRSTTVRASVRQLEERRHAGDEEDAGGDHGRGMDERRNRGRAFHGVRQPGVQQELRRLAHRAHEEQQADGGQRMRLVELHAEQVENDLAALTAAFAPAEKLAALAKIVSRLIEPNRTKTAGDAEQRSRSRRRG